MAVGGVAESPLYDGEHSWSKSPHPRLQSCSSLTLSTAPQTWQNITSHSGALSGNRSAV